MSGLFLSFNMRKKNKRKAVWTCFGVSQGSSFEWFLGHDISSSNTDVFWFSWNIRKSLWEKPCAAATTTITVYSTAWPTMLISCKQSRGKRVGGTGTGKAATKIEQIRNYKSNKNCIYDNGNFLKNPFGCNGKKLFIWLFLTVCYCFCFFPHEYFSSFKQIPPQWNRKHNTWLLNVNTNPKVDYCIPLRILTFSHLILRRWVESVCVTTV